MTQMINKVNSVLKLTRASEFKPKNIQWLWQDWLPRGKLSLLAGPPGTNKTTVSLNFAAIISNAGCFPDRTQCQESGNVVLWSNEDDIEDTLLPRLIAHGANLEKIYFVRAVEDQKTKRPFDPSKDLALLESTIKETGNVHLVILDSAANAVNGDSHNNGTVRKALQPLVDMANEYNLAVLGILHFNKSTETSNPLNRIVGSVGFGSMARLVMVSVIDNDNPDSRLLVRVKSNVGLNGDGFRYSISVKELEEHPGISSIYIKWDESLKGKPEELLGFDPYKEDKSEGTTLRKAKELITDTLSKSTNKSFRASEIETILEENGISISTIKRAKKDLNIESYKSRDCWYWRLPSTES